MTKEEGHRHLKDCLFHGLKPNLHNALHYLYDKPDSQYSQLVMASRKAEIETLRRSMSYIRAKSMVIGADMDLAEAKARADPSYESITQQIAYLVVLSCTPDCYYHLGTIIHVAEHYRNKGRSQLELSVSYLCLSFKLTLPQSPREIQNVT